jgi:hypothetical protein
MRRRWTVLAERHGFRRRMHNDHSFAPRNLENDCRVKRAAP